MQHLSDYGTFDHISVHRLKHEYYQDNGDYNLQSFYDYPERCRWTVGPRFILQRTRHDRPTKFGPFLQSWLWFGLVQTVLQGANGKPLCKESVWIGQHSISTEHLPEALRKWAAFQKRHRKNAKLRIMMAGCVLEQARRAVVANLAYNEGEEEEEWDMKKEKAIAVSDEVAMFRELPRQHPRHISHVTALSIMVFGETLSVQRAKIISDLGLNLHGWHEDKDGVVGWGPLKYVLLKMAEEGWYRRTVRLLRGQLNSSATLLLAILQSHDVSKGHDRYGCTAEVCKAIPASENGGKYQQQHENDCIPEDCSEVMVLPKSAFYSIIEATDQFIVEDNFPIFRYENTDGIVKLSVESWQEHRHRFATISHIWSDGLGNENQNAVHNCKMDYISRLLEMASAEPDDRPNQRLCEWFWLETLGIPRKSDEETIPLSHFKAIKRKSISQIAYIYKKATQSIVIDRGLYNMDASEKKAQTTMRILASGWMRRLWTLHEACLSRELKVMFKQENDDMGGVEGFDDTLSSMKYTTQLLRQMLMQNTMGYKRARTVRINDGLEPRGSLIANAWRAVRWRVLLVCILVIREWSLLTGSYFRQHQTPRMKRSRSPPC